jgi:hypothetical protein
VRPTQRAETVWIDGANQLAIDIGKLDVRVDEGQIHVAIAVRCDEVGSAVVGVLFAVGSDQSPAGLYAAASKRPTGPELCSTCRATFSSPSPGSACSASRAASPPPRARTRAETCWCRWNWWPAHAASASRRWRAIVFGLGASASDAAHRCRHFLLPVRRVSVRPWPARQLACAAPRLRPDGRGVRGRRGPDALWRATRRPARVRRRACLRRASRHEAPGAAPSTRLAAQLATPSMDGDTDGAGHEAGHLDGSAAPARSHAGAADELIVAADLWGYPTHPLRAIVRSSPAPRTRTAHQEAPRPTRFAA